MRSEIYPYAIVPKLVPAIWGGHALVERFGKSGDPAAKIGESWECWDDNAVANGPLHGDTIATLRERLKSDFVGNLDPERTFPILTKIIDARDSLSVQVHPGDAYAQRVERQPNGKTECWYVLDAEPNAELVLGWVRDTSRDEYERRVKDGTLGEILRRVPVQAGQTYYLPAGTLHAIGAGIVVFETQQASDLTYRIFDWNRVDQAGKPRELHVAKAGDVLDFHAGTTGPLQTIEYRRSGVPCTALVADRRFLVERLEITESTATFHTEARPVILMALAGGVRLSTAHGSLELRPYETALVPAAAGAYELVSGEGHTPVMAVTPPARGDAMQQRLELAGVAHERIDAFLQQFAELR
ncbi:MAG: class I mannose-6-phosphate isomerase [Candidatus Eremiobacteraeota bacterium]|nr:class I mannose-6-phosphate isomerase [Candidatus Eremiobacteraeota bacterium]